VTSGGADLRRYLATARRHWILAVAIVLTAAVTGYVVASLSQPSYAATSKVLLDQDRHVDSLLGTSGYAPDPERELNTGVLLITLEPIAAKVRDSLGVPDSAAALAARVSTATDSNSNIVAITARASDPEQAARIANAFAAGYRRYRRQTIRDSVDEALASARARRTSLADASDRDELDAQVRRLQAIAAFDTGGVEVVHRASAAAASESPRPPVSALVAGFLGLIVAAVTIVVLTRTDTRVREERDLEQLVGRPVLAVVRDPADPAEPLLSVAVSLTEPVVLVTSASPGEGAIEVTLGLARALAFTGRTAIALDTESGAGDDLDRLDDDALVPLIGPVDDGGGSAWVVAAGGLGLPRLAALVEAARDRAEVVVIGAPPTAVAAAGPAEVLLVARLDVTCGDELRRALRALTAAGAAPVGVVATTAPPRGPLRSAFAGRRAESRWRPETASEVTVG
jgi:capsular polysaccharide biosynthesis protein